MKIEINNRTKNKIELELIIDVVNAFAVSYKVDAKEISIAFVSGAEIKKLNQAYRGINQATDILSFSGEEEFFGELVLDYSQLKKQAKELGHSLREELIFILVHGLLHLLGYNDETEKDRLKMIKMGEEFIKKMPSFQKEG